MSLRTYVASIVAIAVFGAFEPAARATDNFPPAVESTWNVSQMQLVKAVGGTKGCLLCHTNEVDSPPKFESLVGKYLLSQGVVQTLTSTLTPVLTKMKTDGHDSDGDTFSDYDEVVKYGTNPNLASSHPVIQQPPPPAPTDAGGSGADGGVVTVVDAGTTVTVTPSTSQSVPPLLETGCACAVGKRSDQKAATAAGVTLLLLLASRVRRRGVLHA